MKSYPVTAEKGPRPAGTPTECFYCSAALGAEHNRGCVFRNDPVRVFIRRNSDGVIREYHPEVGWCVDRSNESNQYIWREGNYACDCNRSLFFARAGGEEEIDYDCGETAFTIMKILSKDGEVLYSEAE